MLTTGPYADISFKIAIFSGCLSDIHNFKNFDSYFGRLYQRELFVQIFKIVHVMNVVR